MTVKVLFLDRDGTLIEEPEDNQVDAVEKIQLVDSVIPALLELAKHGFRFVMVSNQDGLGTDAFPQDQFDVCHDHTMNLFKSQGIVFDEVFICPHLPAENCECRKPRTGLLTRFLAATDIDLEASAVIGDRATDMQLAERIGVRGLLVNVDDDEARTWPELVDLLCHSDRVATIERNTNETRISVSVNLDAANQIVVSSGIGFYDHMLEQIAKHGGFGLTLRCDGDLEIDEHHTVEDTAICLGTALRQALGNKFGIGRYGFLLPMDESEAKVALDLSGRASFQFSGKFPRDNVGELSTEMVEHFFRSLAESLGAALHIEVSGENTHHMIEACFKSVGRALRQAVNRDGTDLPSTKGTLG
ncbi:MAG: bifunctional histidinol-phosphatase/imidazoleglycerol-phosphate dehydratase HisB [Gammaproteobacteria bacterium]|nr:bifunctional histidinol-phosphatase/imidazoleglycerol-phosphate dehydratase HisB [Gammaproteobacteria bacterium]MBU2677447.1 bifunctional histidinol-phosphatase/imidazoleglycerol-phosphate dehydratase HisB [Gammaproteobacteria bacterium]NNL51179.1 bifunctional histidinol-phosphatase/imidazoleglycerol-phosphate dehydratase HisB [Woeseiaceae bacterium]